MATHQQDLSLEHKELVAVGASVGAGCHPCVAHHLKAGANAGLGDDQLLAAVTTAERIAAEATILVADHARGRLGRTVITTATLTPLEDTLAAFGAALGANDAAAIALQLRAALDLGASRSQLQQAIETAQNVQENAARIHVREARRLLDSVPAPSTAAATDAKSNSACGCGADDESEAAPQVHDPAGETSNVQTDAEAGRTSDRVAGFKPPMAECFGSAGKGEPDGAAALMAHCRQMFDGRFGKPSATAETNEPPAATAAQGCTGTKEVR